MKFNEKLREIRKESGKTQKDIYNLLNISANGYASWEQGRTEPNIESIIKLCKIFNISADYLLGLEDDLGNKIPVVDEFYYVDGAKKLYHRKKN